MERCVRAVFCRHGGLRCGMGHEDALLLLPPGSGVSSSSRGKRAKRGCDQRKEEGGGESGVVIGRTRLGVPRFDYEPRNHVIPLGTGCVTPRNCSLVLSSDLIANASLSSSPRARSPSSPVLSLIVANQERRPHAQPQYRIPLRRAKQRDCVRADCDGCERRSRGLTSLLKFVNRQHRCDQLGGRRQYRQFGLRRHQHYPASGALDPLPEVRSRHSSPPSLLVIAAGFATFASAPATATCAATLPAPSPSHLASKLHQFARALTYPRPKQPVLRLSRKRARSIEQRENRVCKVKRAQGLPEYHKRSPRAPGHHRYVTTPNYGSRNSNSPNLPPDLQDVLSQGQQI
ncbi:hypothetical protein BDW02DRAFT_107504 [Decorospora gaudefroyi]|uniref:Uncharacterized protein n=1 Tax=Decorospora gaudefroyi TaxID=184978 RepID=A0A6A5KNZ4_9PLEO|nr:hypothetical protein BDW02DRAFT_107504 [Decorospora gaudefroyi]